MPEVGNHADVAQLVEQLIRNQQVSGSNPLVGSKKSLVNARLFYVRIRPPGADWTSLADTISDYGRRQGLTDLVEHVGRSQSMSRSTTRFGRMDDALERRPDDHGSHLRRYLERR